MGGLHSLDALFAAVTAASLGAWFDAAPVGAAPRLDPQWMTLVFEVRALRMFRLEQSHGKGLRGSGRLRTLLACSAPVP